MDKKEAELAAKYIQGKIKKSVPLDPKKHIVPGNVLCFNYSPIGNEPYDKTPLAFVIKDKGDKFLGVNFHWAPVRMRKKIVSEFMKANFINIKSSKPLVFPEKIPDELYRIMSPIFRLYLKNRMSKRIALIPADEVGYVINLRAEKFIGISSEEAYKLYFLKQQKAASKQLFKF